MTHHNKISNLIEEQVPFFVRNDHPQFVAFLKSWLQYMEQEQSDFENGKVLNRLKSMTHYMDIDKTHEDLEEKFFSWFLESFPPKTVADRKIILKSAKDFLRARGTEKSVRFLLNAVLGLESEVYYPKLDILRVSDGKWYIQRTLRVTDIKIDSVANTSLSALSIFEDRRIRGATSNATAIIDSVDRFFIGASQINELTLSAINGTFESAEKVHTTFTEQGVTKTLEAEISGGSIVSYQIIQPGSGYSVNDPLIIEDSTGEGNGAVLRVSSVSTGNVASIQILESGAGFQVNNYVLISGSGGSDANAEVLFVDDSGTAHPNSYNIWISAISLESNTILNDTYLNLNSSVANTVLANALTAFEYANTGPVTVIRVNDSGENYTSVPTFDIFANTRIRALGIIGKLRINNGGQDYANGDIIQFVNGFGSYGVGANAVVSVNASGGIVGYEFTEGYESANSLTVLGGLGYNKNYFPTLNVSTTTGTNANMKVIALLGDGELLTTNTGTLGAITGVTIASGGGGYENPRANLQGSGDGSANITLGVVAGTFQYAGRYLNDDSHISGFSFIEDKDYYQNYSYVLRVKSSLKDYKSIVDDIITPAGVILFGEFMSEDEVSNNVAGTLGNTDIELTPTPNYHPNSFDLYDWWLTNGGANAQSLITRDTETIQLVDYTGENDIVGALKMEITGTDPHIGTYNGSQWNIAPAANGETWRVSVWAKGSVDTSMSIFTFGANTTGKWSVGAGRTNNHTFNISTNWKQYTTEFTFANNVVSYIQTRLDGREPDGAGQTIWFDGYEVFKIS